MKLPEDTRNAFWKKIEKRVQDSASDKDSSFVLGGAWKKFLRNERAYKVFLVDGNWIRSNLSVIFSHGGHGFVHEFIPMNEIWIDTHHHNDKSKEGEFACTCKTGAINQECSQEYIESTILHEITECEEMKKGKEYWESHQIALEAERKAGLLKDPYSDE